MTALLKYEAAKSALAAARKVDEVLSIKDHGERLKLYARQAKDKELLADAAEITVRATRKLGELLKEAKDKGQIAEGRRKKAEPENCSSEEQFPRVTLEEVGIDRKLSMLAQKQAGIGQQAFEAMVEATRGRILAGRAKIIDAEPINGARAVMGSRQEPDDSLDYFPTPPWATRALIERVFPEISCKAQCRAQIAWEPAAGEGHIAEVLGEYFREVVESDIHDYGRPDGHVTDFLACDHINRQDDADWIITNPPFGEKAGQFVLKALPQARVGVAMFFRLQWLETIGRYEEIFAPYPPAIIAQFVERVPLHKGRWEPAGDTATAYLWIVWLKRHKRTTEFFWIPPGCRDALTRPDDVERFTAHPVTRRPADSSGQPLTYDTQTGEIPDDDRDGNHSGGSGGIRSGNAGDVGSGLAVELRPRSGVAPELAEIPDDLPCGTDNRADPGSHPGCGGIAAAVPVSAKAAAVDDNGILDIPAFLRRTPDNKVPECQG